MFYNCNNFNQNIDKWDTRKVTNMDSMFVKASKFKQPLDSWKINNVEKIKSIFYYDPYDIVINSDSDNTKINMVDSSINTDFKDASVNYKMIDSSINTDNITIVDSSINTNNINIILY